MTRKEIVGFLTGREMADDDLFAAARAVRGVTFQDYVVVRGALELTNLCRVNCMFCPMRRDNTQVNSTYLLSDETIIERSGEMRKAGINVVLIQGGEIPQTTEILQRVIPLIRKLYHDRVEILLNMGSKSRAEYDRLKKAGAHSYILKHETVDADLYEALKLESFDGRLRCMSDLMDLGFKVGTGSIVGLPGQTIESIAEDILLASRLGVHMVSASPFIPAPGTPLENFPAGSPILTLRVIATSRLLMPRSLIPSVSALEICQPGGQAAGLQAGANVLTVNFTPVDQRKNYLIYGSNRYVVTLQHVQDLLRTNALRSHESYWVPRELI